MTRPCLRITLHLSQIGLTLGFTFTAVSILFCLVVGWFSRGLVWSWAGLVVGWFGYLYRYTMRPRDRS
jgi:hypothetical protein